jgi:hypothetical protein
MYAAMNGDNPSWEWFLTAHAAANVHGIPLVCHMHCLFASFSPFCISIDLLVLFIITNLQHPCLLLLFIITNMLQIMQNPMLPITQMVEAARSGGLPFRLSEANSVTSGGIEGVSDTLAAVLWLLDWSFEVRGHQRQGGQPVWRRAQGGADCTLLGTAAGQQVPDGLLLCAKAPVGPVTHECMNESSLSLESGPLAGADRSDWRSGSQLARRCVPAIQPHHRRLQDLRVRPRQQPKHAPQRALHGHPGLCDGRGSRRPDLEGAWEGSAGHTCGAGLRESLGNKLASPRLEIRILRVQLCPFQSDKGDSILVLVTQSLPVAAWDQGASLTDAYLLCTSCVQLPASIDSTAANVKGWVVQPSASWEPCLNVVLINKDLLQFVPAVVDLPANATR